MKKLLLLLIFIPSVIHAQQREVPIDYNVDFRHNARIEDTAKVNKVQFPDGTIQTTSYLKDSVAKQINDSLQNITIGEPIYVADSGQIKTDIRDLKLKTDTISSGGGSWGSIIGTLSNQTDLQNALDSKVNYSDTTGATKKIATWSDVQDLTGGGVTSAQLATPGGVDVSHKNIDYTREQKDYFYPGWKWSKSVKNVDSTGGYFCVFIGDSRMAAEQSYISNSLQKKTKQNGVMQFFGPAMEGHTVTSANTTYTGSFTNTDQFGFGGQTCLIKSGGYVKLVPTTLSGNITMYMYSKIRIYYQKGPTMGEWRYKFANGSWNNVTATNATSDLGYVDIANASHIPDSLRIENVSDSCRFFGIKFWNEYGKGIIPAYLGVSSSRSGHYTSNFFYLKKFLQLEKPKQVHLMLIVNGDLWQGLHALMDSINKSVPYSCDEIIYTAPDHGQTPSYWLEDVATSTAWRAVNDTVFSFCKDSAYSVFDMHDWGGTRLQGYLNSIYADRVHFTGNGYKALSQPISNITANDAINTAFFNLNTSNDIDYKLNLNGKNSGIQVFYDNGSVRTITTTSLIPLAAGSGYAWMLRFGSNADSIIYSGLTGRHTFIYTNTGSFLSGQGHRNLGWTEDFTVGGDLRGSNDILAQNNMYADNYLYNAYGTVSSGTYNATSNGSIAKTNGISADLTFLQIIGGATQTVTILNNSVYNFIIQNNYATTSGILTGYGRNLTIKPGGAVSFIYSAADSRWRVINYTLGQAAPLSYNVTDGAPTATEINAATGLIPSTAGTGYKDQILDSAGSGLLYNIWSDGTNWQYNICTIAL